MVGRIAEQSRQEGSKDMTDDTLQWSSIGVAALAIILIVLAAVGVIPSWVIAIAILGGIGGNLTLLYYWGKDYMERG